MPFDPKEEGHAAAFAKWALDNAKVRTCFHNSIELNIDMNFSKYKMTKEVWEYLWGMYFRSNFVK